MRVTRRALISGSVTTAATAVIAAPGTEVHYSTFGYTLASLVLEAASGTRFLALVEREIATPLALGSLAGDAPLSIVPQRVRGYQSGDITRKLLPDFVGPWGNIVQGNPAYKWAGGGLLATPTDLARFGAAHLAAGELPAAALETLFTVYTAATNQSPPLGLGWRIDADAHGRTRWHHAGGQDGARACLVVYPKQQLAIAFATNVTGAPADVLTPSSALADVFSSA